MSGTGGLLTGARRLELKNGESLRLLSAMEVLEARREGETLKRDGREGALCANACLLARALEREGQPVFADGEEVLRRLTVEEITVLSRQWAAFDREENPSLRGGEEQAERLKKAWSTRRRSGCAGVC